MRGPATNPTRDPEVTKDPEMTKDLALSQLATYLVRDIRKLRERTERTEVVNEIGVLRS